MNTYLFEFQYHQSDRLSFGLSNQHPMDYASQNIHDTVDSEEVQRTSEGPFAVLKQKLRMLLVE